MKQGARFSAVAQQFSQSATAAVGGDIGWVRAEQLSPSSARRSPRCGRASCRRRSEPARGFYLLLVLDRRARRGRRPGRGRRYDLVQIVFPLPPQAPEAVRRAAIIEAQSAKTTAKNCEDC